MVLLGIVERVVDAVDEVERPLFPDGCGHHDLGGPGVEIGPERFDVPEAAGAVHDEVDAARRQRQVPDTLRPGDFDAVPVDRDRARPVADPGVPAPVHGVEFQQVRVAGGVAQPVVRQHDLAQPPGAVHRPQEQLADAAEAIDRYARHRSNPGFAERGDPEPGL